MGMLASGSVFGLEEDSAAAASAFARGPRIYNLFPLLCGPASSWPPHLARAAAMGFDWVYLNPVHYPGFSGSLYAVKDYFALHPLIAGDDSRPPAQILRAVVEEASRHGLRVMMDLVVNHTAKDSPLVAEHPEWYAWEPDGSVRSPHAIDPADARNVTVWGDLAEIDYSRAEAAAGATRFWCEVVRHYAEIGIAGFRCDAAYKVPAEVWHALVLEARRAMPEALFCAETLGCRLDQVEGLARAGFDYLFNSVKWWDLRAPWAIEQYERFRRVAPSIGFPESHDTERLVSELPAALAQNEALLRKAYLLRYALAACFSAGVMMPVGYEFAFSRKLDVVRTRPEDWVRSGVDLRDDIAAINRMKRDHPALNCEGPQRLLSDGEGAAVLFRRSEDGAHAALFIANPFDDRAVTVDLAGLAAAAHRAPESLADLTPRAAAEDTGPTLVLAPLEWRLMSAG